MTHGMARSCFPAAEGLGVILNRPIEVVEKRRSSYAAPEQQGQKPCVAVVQTQEQDPQAHDHERHRIGIDDLSHDGLRRRQYFPW